MEYISSIPNLHRFQWSDASSQVKFEHRFIGIPRSSPKSPRNRIISALAQNRGNVQNILNGVIINMLGIPLGFKKKPAKYKGKAQLYQAPIM